MSHIVSIRTKVQDIVAVAAACHRLGLAAPFHGTARLFGGEASGVLVQFPGWRYPAIIDTTSGEVRFDNYAGQWGDRKNLDRFLQLYAVEKAKLEARKKGHVVTETLLQDGSIRVQIATV